MGRWSRHQSWRHSCRNTLVTMPLFPVLLPDSGMWYCHWHARPPLRLMFKASPACWVPCLSLFRLTSDYQYLRLFATELSLTWQRLLGLDVGGWKYERINISQLSTVIDGSWCINTQASSPLRWNYPNVFILYHLPKEISSGHLTGVAAW